MGTLISLTIILCAFLFIKIAFWLRDKAEGIVVIKRIKINGQNRLKIIKDRGRSWDIEVKHQQRRSRLGSSCFFKLFN